MIGAFAVGFIVGALLTMGAFALIFVCAEDYKERRDKRK